MNTQERLNELFYYSDGMLFNKIDRKRAKKGARAGCKQKDNPYRQATVDGITDKEHRLIYVMFYGEIPEGKIINHDSNDLTDEGVKSNKIENLEAVTPSINTFKARVPRSSKYIGVSYYKRHGKWVAHTSLGVKSKSIGYRDTQIEAAKIYDEYIVSIGLGGIEPLNRDLFPEDAW